MTKPSVVVEGLSKKFGLSLKTALKYGFVDSFRRLTGRGKETHLRTGEFWALSDVNFTLEPGDALGIMGINGSGKTTMLRILNGTYTPDKGKVMLRGRVGALIAAGAGFSPMLSGRENVYISGTLLGMHPKEIRARFDEIVDFADLGEFIDMPVRNYSSGMTVRLGFAIAVLGSPEILLVDEVLAVGDLAFQKKCYERIFSMKKEGTTIMLVSHSPGAIWAVCNKALMLHHGLVTAIGDVEEVVRGYDEANFRATLANSKSKEANSTFKEVKVPEDKNNDTAQNNIEDAFGEMSREYNGRYGGTGEVFVDSFRLLDSQGTERLNNEFYFAEPFFLEAVLNVKSIVSEPLIRFTIDAVHYKYIATIDTYEQNFNITTIEPGQYIIKAKVDKQNFRPGSYSINFGISSRRIAVLIVFLFNAGNFTIMHPRTNFLYSDPHAVMHIPAEFSMKKH